MTSILATVDVARILGVTCASVRAYETKGQLRANRTPSGIRVFSESEVLRFKQERSARNRFRKSAASSGAKLGAVSKDQ